MRISFDFVDTLSTRKMKMLLSIMDRSKVEVFIITSRSEDVCQRNKDLWEEADRLQIPRENVHLTSGMPKGEVCLQLEIDMHFDDMPEEIAYIQAKCPKTMGVLVGTNIWKSMDDLNNFYYEPTPSIQQYSEEFR
jgi:hypothetical protein